MGYQRQYAVVALANEMAAGTLVVSQTGKPDAQQSKKMIAAVDKVTGQLLITMQSCVQMVRVARDVNQRKRKAYIYIYIICVSTSCTSYVYTTREYECMVTHSSKSMDQPGQRLPILLVVS